MSLGRLSQSLIVDRKKELEYVDFSDVIGDNCSNIDSTKIASILRGESIILTGAIRVAKHNTLLKEACGSLKIRPRCL
jgi:hypothetical protein